jgi:type I restriction enzyme S subunit
MKSNYKRLGSYIKEVGLRNTKGELSTLLGINIDKYYMPSVANIVGTDLNAYKIVKRNQFACNRMHVGRDKRLPVALSKTNEDFIVSPAYDVFEITNENSLLPEYLMMWFSRKEFDRNAWFYTDADVRGGLSWKDLCNMQLPVPQPDKQREIIKEYNIIVNRIALNNQIIKNLKKLLSRFTNNGLLILNFQTKMANHIKAVVGKWQKVN